MKMADDGAADVVPPSEVGRGGSPGLHHVTAICGDAQGTVDFYVRTLGLRMLKRTVNFDDPSTYHLYFGDGVGHPGTTLTFFAWRNLPEGRPGAGQAVRVAFKVPAGSLDEWKGRLDERGVRVEDEATRFGRRTLPLRDPEGLGLALVEHETVDPGRQWRDGPLDPEMAIAGFHGVSLLESVAEPTREVLGDLLGLREAADEDGRIEMTAVAADRDDERSAVEVVRAPSASPGRVARGSIHHVAFRARDEEHQEALREAVAGAGLAPTPVIDRFYFKSVYFHEPGGVLFEIATDGPGFTRDQEVTELGRGLSLPPWLEARRSAIERHLDPIEVPGP